jgi:formylglycine-generating enzyme required for sulfatase activity
LTDAVRTVTSQRCPRCSAPVGGDFKFCPACAYRLRSGLPEASPAPPARSSALRVGFLAALVVAATLAGALGYVLLVHPGLVQPEPPPARPPQALELDKVLTVADIPSLLVELERGYAGLVGFDTEASADEEPRIYAEVPRFRILRYEVTQEMYAECLRDVEAHPERIPAAWLVTAAGRIPREQARVLDHVPTSWRILDRDDPSLVVGWRADPAQANLPVTQVTFHEAQGFARWAGARLGIELDVPVLFEWVRAARAGRQDDNPWPWGDEKYYYACNSRAFWSQGEGSLHPVMYWYSEPAGTGGASSENVFGLAGNAREMAFAHGMRVVRELLGRRYAEWDGTLEGYAWACGGSYRSGIDDCRAESRDALSFGQRYDDVGFRVVQRKLPD